MIEIENEQLRIKDISRLMCGNPVNAVFESLIEIWKFLLVESISDYYIKGEEFTSKFEKQIFTTFPEVYGVMVKSVERNTTISDILSEDCFCLVIMDGMSLREAPFIINELGNEYELKFNYSYSAIPSETRFFTLKNFGMSSPSEITRKELPYRFVHLIREEQVEEIGLESDRLLIWSTHPDQLFSQFKAGFETQDLAQVAKKTKSIIVQLLKHLKIFGTIIITSDHGYFVDTYSWEGLRDFPSGERYSEVLPEHLKKYCRFVNDHWILIGRYNTIKRGKYAHIRHGGLSFLECLVPLIEIRRKQGGK